MKRFICICVVAVLLCTGCAQPVAHSASLPEGAVQGSQPQSSSQPQSGGGQLNTAPRMRCLYYERDAFLKSVGGAAAYAVQGELFTGMVPHHLVAADMIAGFFAMAAGQAKSYDAVVVVSTSHFTKNCNSDVVTANAGWETPYGQVPPAASAVQAVLQDVMVKAEDNPVALEADHGVGGLMPYISYYLPGVPVAGILIANTLAAERLEALRGVLAQVCAQQNVLLVFSIDCSHYLMPEEAAERDSETRRAIESFDVEACKRFTDSNVDSPQGLVLFLSAVRELGGDLNFLDGSSSYEKLSYGIQNPAYKDGITTYLVYAGTRKEPAN